AITEAIDVDGIKFVLVGGDLAGKSATCKYIFRKYYELGLRPILLTGSDFKNNLSEEFLKKLLNEKLAAQYSKSCAFNGKDGSKFILIVDDFHKATKGKHRYWSKLIQNLDSLCKNIVLTGSQLMPIENI